jgi:hypothetical protein
VVLLSNSASVEMENTMKNASAKATIRLADLKAVGITATGLAHNKS